MKIRVEILRWEKSGEEPRILYSCILEPVSLPEPPHGYRIVTEQGTELYGWAA